MQLGIVGLGRMGGNIARRLARAEHECVVFDQNAAAVKGLTGEGMSGANGLDALVKQLSKPRTVWLMLPAGNVTDIAIEQLSGLLDRGDVVIDGGNTFYKDDIRRANALKG